MKIFINLIIQGKLINQNEKIIKSDNPKISIVISVYNGEKYLKNAILSIQNQDFKDIEIIMIDDCSEDKSVNLIKELMLKDPRIILYQNEENKGALYTKTKGVLNSKGKYVMILDEDDFYCNKKAFSILYEEAEKNNLDIIGFYSFETIVKNEYLNFMETPFIFMQNITERMYTYKKDGSIKRIGGVLYNCFFRTDLFIKTIKEIDEKYFKIKMNTYDDFLLFFLLTRNAYNLKQINNVLFLKIKWEEKPNINNITKDLSEKNKIKENLDCMANLYYIEMLLIKTNNTILDKQIPSYELNNFLLNDQCKNNLYVKEKFINICKQFLENEYIENEIKEKIMKEK